jgi:phenylacetate-CoA ligase
VSTIARHRQAHVAELLAGAPAAIERMTWHADRIRAFQEVRLRELLTHAREHSPFHRERLADVDPAWFTIDRLGELPVMTKTEMMRRFHDVVTNRSLARGLVDRQVASAPAELTYLLGRYLVMASGGSSGERGVFVSDAAEFTEFALSLLRGTIATLTAFGIGPDNPIPGALVAAGSTVHGTGAVGALAGGEGAPVAMTRISATRPLPEIVATLERVQPLVLVAYPSVLVRLAAERAAGRLAIAPLAVGSTSEPLSVDDRASIETAFGVPMTDTFGSSEGLCGVSAPGERPIAFATDSCIVELVDDDLRPVPPGVVSAKVLVTNLYNRTQPLIRYELSDRFVEVPGPHPDGRLRAIVDGRHDRSFRYGDVEVHPLAVRAALVRFADVFEHQVAQTERGIEVSLVAADGFDPAVVESALVRALEAAGLEGPEVTVRAVDGLPRDPLTGKPRRFVPLG